MFESISLFFLLLSLFLIACPHPPPPAAFQDFGLNYNITLDVGYSGDLPIPGLNLTVPLVGNVAGELAVDVHIASLLTCLGCFEFAPDFAFSLNLSSADLG